MAKYMDILGNENFVADKTITISLERFESLIITEYKYNEEHRCKKNVKESEEK